MKRDDQLGLATKELELLYEIVLELDSEMDSTVALEHSMRMLKQASYLDRCALFIANEEQDGLSLLVSMGLSEQQKQMASYRFGEGATGLAAQSGEPIVIENVHNAINYLNKVGDLSLNMISYVAVPLMQKERVLGVISANMTDKTPYGINEIVRMLTIIGAIFTKMFMTKVACEIEKEQIEELNSYYKEELGVSHNFENIIGKSKKMQQIFSILQTISPTPATVLIRGETGTGKELIASAIHNLSDRKNAPFIKLNCAAISDTLLESELFGHEKGAFTDAKEMRKGRFELAHKGTIFLDEIGDISESLQVKLLRVLQEHEFERVGGSQTVKVDVRIVAATNRNLEDMVKHGEFREDLYYRLNVIPINLPPLRERYEDVKLLIFHYFDNYKTSYKKKMHLPKEPLEILLNYPWPGNIRELQNTMERLVLICPEGEVELDMLNHVLPYNYQKNYMSQREKTEEVSLESQALPKPKTQDDIIALEKEAIINALEECHNIQAKAAKKLGMTARQIGYKIKKYGIAC
ncbi:MAG: sigma 54-interacting transcriptional regulator [Epsilonproteobacteria bacterium]|nr:sigma 54-interacting transcriptional regulator [Campylobacterota bacterium]